MEGGDHSTRKDFQHPASLARVARSLGGVCGAGLEESLAAVVNGTCERSEHEENCGCCGCLWVSVGGLGWVFVGVCGWFGGGRE